MKMELTKALKVYRETYMELIDINNIMHLFKVKVIIILLMIETIYIFCIPLI